MLMTTLPLQEQLRSESAVGLDHLRCYFNFFYFQNGVGIAEQLAHIQENVSDNHPGAMEKF